MDSYKVDILKKMLEAEEAPNGGFGARLYMGWTNLKPITLDSGAIKVLIDYYENKED